MHPYIHHLFTHTHTEQERGRWRWERERARTMNCLFELAWYEWAHDHFKVTQSNKLLQLRLKRRRRHAGFISAIEEQSKASVSREFARNFNIILTSGRGVSRPEVRATVSSLYVKRAKSITMKYFPNIFEWQQNQINLSREVDAYSERWGGWYLISRSHMQRIHNKLNHKIMQD